jgi:hypothetical protein
VKISVKESARAVVADVAPDELELFEQMWAEHSENPALLTAAPESGDQHLGVGGAIWDSHLMTLLIIPAVVAVAKDTAGKGMAAIVEFVKRRLSNSAGPAPAKLSEDEIDRIARSIAAQLRARE